MGWEYMFPWFLNILKLIISPVKSACHKSVYKNPKDARLCRRDVMDGKALLISSLLQLAL